jgi:hypothetical protein
MIEIIKNYKYKELINYLRQLNIKIESVKKDFVFIFNEEYLNNIKELKYLINFIRYINFIVTGEEELNLQNINFRENNIKTRGMIKHIDKDIVIYKAKLEVMFNSSITKVIFYDIDNIIKILKEIYK